MTHTTTTHSTTAHSTTAKAVRGGLLAAAALLAAGLAPSPAAAQEARAGNWIYLTVTHDGPRSTETRGTMLQCAPPRGGHAHAAQACAELTAAGGDLAAIPQKDVYCPMVYAPVTVEARGQWNDRPVEYTETFSNACEMEARTGSVFALDG